MRSRYRCPRTGPGAFRHLHHRQLAARLHHNGLFPRFQTEFVNEETLIDLPYQSQQFAIINSIHAVYENGVFRPLDAVDLPEATEVVFEPRPIVPRMTPEVRGNVLAVLAQRFDSGETDVAARHNEPQP